MDGSFRFSICSMEKVKGQKSDYVRTPLVEAMPSIIRSLFFLSSFGNMDRPKPKLNFYDFLFSTENESENAQFFKKSN